MKVTPILGGDRLAIARILDANCQFLGDGRLLKGQIQALGYVALCAAALLTVAGSNPYANAPSGSKLCGRIQSEEFATPSVPIKGGIFAMGSDKHHPEERPRRDIVVSDFDIDRHEVTNAEFEAFVDATGYVTVAERPVDPALYPNAPAELLEAGSFVFRRPETAIDLADFHQWWTYMPGASWRHPEGVGSSIAERQNHPVVHVVHADALAYAHWKGRDLPTEAEWEYAARGGQDTDYSWGNDRIPDGTWQANVWQGLFPISNKLIDGFEGTAPAGCYMPNGYGLFDMAGNVWEITADDYADFRGPQPGMKTVKGGSHLCGENYCDRYRPSARQPASADAGASHIGFRTIKRISGADGT